MLALSLVVRRFKFICLVLLGTTAAVAQTNRAHAHRAHSRPTELVVARYEKLVMDGALLSPEGWSEVAKLFYRSAPYPDKGSIQLTDYVDFMAEQWVREDRAEVDTKWDDDYGAITPSLRYKPIDEHITVLPFAQVFSLIYTDKHQDVDQQGNLIRETLGSWEWKIDFVLRERTASLDKAIQYVSEMQNKTTDPIIQKNAERTLRILKRLGRSCGSASAC